MRELMGGCDSAECHRTRPRSESSDSELIQGWYQKGRGGLTKPGRDETNKTVRVLDNLNTVP